MSASAAKTVAIIGGGPTGLAAAAHALGRGIEPIVLEQGEAVGHAVAQWGHVRMFSPWRYNVDKASESLLLETGWNSPDPDHYPTGAELVAHYLEPLATRTRLAAHVRTDARVTSISRAGLDKAKTAGREKAPFEIRYSNGKGPSVLRADAVIDASGTWGTPNPAGANGLEAIGEAEHGGRIAYGMPDVLGAERTRYAGKTVAVLGAGHSAIGTIIDLARLKETEPGTQIVWLLRGDNPEKSFGGGANDKLAARGELGLQFAGIVRQGGVRIETGFRASHVTTSGEGRASRRRGIGMLRSQRDRRRADRGYGIPPGLVVPARAAHRAGPGARMPPGAGAADRPQPAQLRHRAPARRARAGAARARLLSGGHEVLRAGADVPDDDGLRAGALDHGRYCRRPGRGRARRAGAAGDRGVQRADRRREPLRARAAAAGRHLSATDACCRQDADAKAAGDKGCGCG